MSINLAKGENINLNKVAEGETEFTLGLGWDAAAGAVKHDLDVSVFMLNSAGKLINDKSFVFYNNLQDPTGAVKHSGDSRDGAGDGDDESVTLKLPLVPAEVDRMVVVTSIHEETTPKTINFGQVRNSFIRVMNSSKVEIAKADLNEDYSGKRAISFGTVYRSGSEWKFKSEAEAVEGGLEEFLTKYNS